MKKYLILLAKLVVFALLFVLIMGGLSVPLMLTGDLNAADSGDSLFIVAEAIQFVSVLLASWIIIRFWDKLPFVDNMGFSLRGRGKDLLLGLAVAAGIYAVGFGVSVLAGWVNVTGVHFDAVSLLVSFILMVMVALAEESMVRGFVLGHMLDVGMNKFLALVLSSLIFAAMHLGNPGMSVISFINIALAGVLLGAAYIYTRNLWFSISLHLFWNWIQGPVLGYEVSGTSNTSTLLALNLSDNTLMNGGNFGFEASLPCTILMLAAIVCIIYLFENNKKPYEKTVSNGY